jgi:hypothetical protein
MWPRKHQQCATSAEGAPRDTFLVFLTSCHKGCSQSQSKSIVTSGTEGTSERCRPQASRVEEGDMNDSCSLGLRGFQSTLEHRNE